MLLRIMRSEIKVNWQKRNKIANIKMQHHWKWWWRRRWWWRFIGIRLFVAELVVVVYGQGFRVIYWNQWTALAAVVYVCVRTMSMLYYSLLNVDMCTMRCPHCFVMRADRNSLDACVCVCVSWASELSVPPPRSLTMTGSLVMHLIVPYQSNQHI